MSSCVDFELWIGQKATGRRQRGSKSIGKSSPNKGILQAKTLFQVSQAEQIKQEREEGSKEEKAKSGDKMEAEESAS